MQGVLERVLGNGKKGTENVRRERPASVIHRDDS